MSQRSITSFFSPKPLRERIENSLNTNGKEDVESPSANDAAETIEESSPSASVSTSNNADGSPVSPRNVAKSVVVNVKDIPLKPGILRAIEERKRQKESNLLQKNEQVVKKKRMVIESDSDSDEERKRSPQPKKRLSSDDEHDFVNVKKGKFEAPIEEETEQKPKTKAAPKSKKKPAESPAKSREGDDDLPKTAKSVASFFGAKGVKAESSCKGDSDYNPAVADYHPIDHATWKRSEKVPYMALARTLAEIEGVSARLKIIEILSNFFRSVMVLSRDDLLSSLYLCLNKLAPAYKGLELGIAETSLMKVIAQSTGRTLAQVRADTQSAGDMGVVAERSRSNQRMIFQPTRLTVGGVFDKLKEIANMTGHASQAKKMDKIQTMFVACRDCEARFLIRSLAGKLRIGLAEQSVLQALALACATTPPAQSYPPEQIDASKTVNFKARYDELALILKTTYCECPNYDLIIPALLRDGIEKLPEHCRLTPGVPLRPMLAHPTKGIQEVLRRFDGIKFTCEWKYDGERAQIHVDDGGTVSIFSRNQENNTSKYPDVIGRLGACKKEGVKSCILDCETVAWDKENRQILPFQILSTRKRKDANEQDIVVEVCVFMFDLLYLNGEPLVKKPFAERRALLLENFEEVEGQWRFAKSLDTGAMEEVQEFLEESVKGKCEGLMIKTLDEEATYEIAKRSRNWLKLKKDYVDGAGDTLDVVVVGGYLGRGKRAGTYGGFLLACYDKDNEEYQSICKIGTGFSDDDLQKHTDFFKEHIVDEPKSYYRYDSSHEPDRWFDAVQVWEIKCADLSLSPVHRAAIGIVDPEKGISLRFPRFVRVRDDKGVEDATSARQVADMYNDQDQIKGQQGGVKVAEEDFY